MNNRDYKIFRTGHIYHIYNRGNNKQTIFFDEQDYSQFLKRLVIILGKAKIPLAHEQGESLLLKYPLRIKPFLADSFSILSYCWMPNHFHIEIKQNGEIPISKLISKLCTSYAMYFNKKYDRVGNVFQDAFKAKLIESDAYAIQLSMYIHANPDKPFEYKHSSLEKYINPNKSGICDTTLILKYFDNDPAKYKKQMIKYISNKDDLNLGYLSFDD